MRRLAKVANKAKQSERTTTDFNALTTVPPSKKRRRKLSDFTDSESLDQLRQQESSAIERVKLLQEDVRAAIAHKRAKFCHKDVKLPVGLS